MTGTTQAGSDTRPIIVFDGLCVLCSANAQFVLRHDRRGHFRLATVQGPAGRALCQRFGVDPDTPDTVIVVSGTTVRRDSEAVLAICRGLGWPWRAAGVLRLVPRPLRDRLYRFVARNRYRVFGRRTACWLPTPEQAARIL